MATPSDLTLATFTPLIGKKTAIPVQFNPASLQYTLTNTLSPDKANRHRQYVGQTTGKLTLDLIFDTTHDGSDVRDQTNKIMNLMHPIKEGKKEVAAVVELRWGDYIFKGMIETYKETIDFFSANGVPLRASINLTLNEQDVTFSAATNQHSDKKAQLNPEPVVLPPNPKRSPADVARQSGNPSAGAAVAQMNNQASMRFSSGPLSITASVALKGPVAFASASAGIRGGAGVSASAGFGISGGVGVSASAGTSVRLSSAGVSASAGGFAQLRATPTNLNVNLDPSALLPQIGAGASVSASIGVGGRASGGSAGMKADVGADGGLSAQITFED
jgi:hypothetical protein